MTLADKVDLPIVLYNIPGRTGVTMSPQTVARLDEHPNIVAIKEATGSLDMASEIMCLCDITDPQRRRLADAAADEHRRQGRDQRRVEPAARRDQEDDQARARPATSPRPRPIHHRLFPLIKSPLPRRQPRRHQVRDEARRHGHRRAAPAAVGSERGDEEGDRRAGQKLGVNVRRRCLATHARDDPPLRRHLRRSRSGPGATRHRRRPPRPARTWSSCASTTFDRRRSRRDIVAAEVSTLPVHRHLPPALGRRRTASCRDDERVESPRCDERLGGSYVDIELASYATLPNARPRRDIPRRATSSSAPRFQRPARSALQPRSTR